MNLKSVLERAECVFPFGKKGVDERKIAFAGLPLGVVLASVLAMAPNHADAYHFNMPQSKNISADRYDREDVFRNSNVRYAEVLQVQRVKVQNENTLNGGTAIGAGIGYSLGRDRSNSDVGGLLGSLVGGVIGGAAQRALSRKDAYRITIGDSGSVYNIVQGADVSFRPGELVQIEQSADGPRVVKVDQAVRDYLQGNSNRRSVGSNYSQTQNSGPSYREYKGPGY